MAYTYKYARPALTVDCVVFAFDDARLKVLLIERGAPPFDGNWALPGGFVQVGEPIEGAARRELAEETGVKDIFLEQLYTFGNPERDPREHVVSVAYLALIRRVDHQLQAATDARAARWFDVVDLPALAFDHQRIFDLALARMRSKLRYQPVCFELLPPKFTLTQLQSLYEIILGRSFDKRNFRKKILGQKILEGLREKEQNVAHRAARLYQFDAKKLERLEKRGDTFQL